MMKRIISIVCVLALLLSCAACGSRKTEPETPENNEALALRLIDGAGTQRFVLAGEAGGDVYTVETAMLTVFLDGEAAAPADLENGMILTFDTGYTLLETWPMQITNAVVHTQSETENQADHGDLCGVYLQVLEDLWTNDSGLNENITYISVDLGEAPGDLTDGEKAAIAWIFSGRHNAQGLQLSFEALAENGYLKEGMLYWEDGALFSITEPEHGNSTANKLKFNARKWRSGTGAIFFDDCTAKRGKGVQWKSYQIGGFAIS